MFLQSSHSLATMMFVPSVEIKLDGEESFLLEPPTDLLISNKAKKIPVIIGTNSDEGAMFADGKE